MYAQNTSNKTITIILLVCATFPTTFAQISREHIEDLKAQAIEQGWTFTVGETNATQRPREWLCGGVPPNETELQSALSGGSAGAMGADIELPSRFDWRDYNVVPEPRAQGDCGSCYAFAAMGIVESSILIRSHLRPDYMDLSEQWIVSCCPWAWAENFSLFS